MRVLTRGDRALCWIENYCRYPDGPDKGKHVMLTQAECWQVRQLYDNPSGPDRDTPLTGSLAAYLALLHTCGPRHCRKNSGRTLTLIAGRYGARRPRKSCNVS